MRRHLDAGRRRRRRFGTGVAAAAALAVAVGAGVQSSSAAWVSSTTLGDAVGSASSSCTTPGVYRTTASSRWLAGSVAGAPLTARAALAPMTADNPASIAVFPAGAVPQGSDAATTAVSSASAAAALGSALTAPSGSQTQYAAATSTGTSVAGVGAVDTAGIASGSAPALGALDVDGLLGQVSGGTAAAGDLSRLRLAVGRVAATSTLRECSRRWGASLASALDRGVTVSSLSLTTRTASVTRLVGATGAQRAAVRTAFDAVTGGAGTSPAETSLAGTAGTGLVGAVNAALGSLGSLARAGGASATVRIGADLGAVDTAAAQTTPAGGLVRLDASAGDVVVDVGSLAPAAPAPNTALLTAADASRIASGTSAAAGAVVTDVGAAWSAAASEATVSVDVSVPVVLAGATIATVGESMSGTVAQFAAGTETRSAPSVVVLSVLDPTSLLAAVTAQLAPLLLGPVEGAVGTVVSAPLTAAVADAKGSLATSLTAARSALPGELGVLPAVLSVTLNEQPDVAPHPAPAAGTGGGYRTTALRLKVLGGSALDLAVATTSVGPDRTVNE
ncbi:hypothetical protein GCM10025783_16940 [Amnibacterium soli]|uniref:Choice-of-anchor G family protein n=1 Tax=Amnibacterium soli TaxID=1282736 RepID=A0ABP8Z3N8_9MICO